MAACCCDENTAYALWIVVEKVILVPAAATFQSDPLIHTLLEGTK